MICMHIIIYICIELVILNILYIQFDINTLHQLLCKRCKFSKLNVRWQTWLHELYRPVPQGTALCVSVVLENRNHCSCIKKKYTVYTKKIRKERRGQGAARRALTP